MYTVPISLNVKNDYSHNINVTYKLFKELGILKLLKL